MAEIWKDIPGWEGDYQVSNLGRVKRLFRLSSNSKKMPEKILKIKNKENSKYLRVKLYKNSKGRGYYVHQLLAMCFLGHTLDSNLVVDHIDNNPLNNNLNNLQLVTRRKNFVKDNSNKNGFTGVACQNGYCRASVMHHKKRIHLGNFKTPEEASDAYQKYISENNC
tara:strand:- start:107 stop:604 length:498 start_codon:yes stop_codon:yes gene_type:complete